LTFDGSFSWKVLHEVKNATKTILVEEPGFIAGTGADYPIPPQEALILFPSK